MARLILIVAAWAAVPIALTLFLGLILEKPRFWAFSVGMAPLLAVS